MCRTLLFFTFLFLQYIVLCQSPSYQWAKQFGATSFFNSGYDGGRSIDVDDMGNVYSIGTFINELDFDPGSGFYPLKTENSIDYEVYLSKLDPFGQFVWAKKIPLKNPTQIFLKLDKDANIYIISTLRIRDTIDVDPGPGVSITYPIGAENGFLLKFDKNGNFNWFKQFGGTNAGLWLKVKNYALTPCQKI